MKRRAQLGEGGASDAEEGSKTNPLALAENDWVNTAIDVIHTAVDNGTVGSDQVSWVK